MNIASSAHFFTKTFEHNSSHRLWILRIVSLLCGLSVCVNGSAAAQNSSEKICQTEEKNMWLTVGERHFAITLADTEAAIAFAEMLPLSIDMIDLHKNEKYADLPSVLPTSASRPGKIHDGDLMLYGSKTLVIFYQTFDSSYSYTRIGYVEDTKKLSEALGRSGVRVKFSESLDEF